ncbi:hypothetical protein CU669_19900 [Paramagnetospirillum kuznetsovii]|uniref:RepB-like DNA primase domain-containing protein n=1 Tax=Paramagnetospirillum kuznetsovii TaxID=2053833 RepID=A0A364NTB5_9PROT|nr:DNA-primase RepB domain-containing protein [Paramagnetospirillum kuznetsovii]RAU20155.1 hypothetical protein CU669_19900 [Paramagnetospirillum kuznetsovii]
MSRMADSAFALAKETIACYRRAPLATVAKLLDYHGPSRWHGAIDMVMELRACPYHDAVTFLHEHLFGGAGGDAKGGGWIKALTPQERAVKAAWRQQLDALGADRYRLTMFHRDVGRTYRSGKHRNETEEVFYTNEQLLESVQETFCRNWQRSYNVYITPFSDTLTYFLVDDVMPEAKARMDASGFRPLIYQSTSWQSWQVVLAVPKSDLGDDQERRLANFTFKRLNELYGDAGIGGQIHPFRATGFQNRKPKYETSMGRYPTVDLIDGRPGTICERTRAFIVEMRAEATKKAAPVRMAGLGEQQLSEDGRAKIAACQARPWLLQYAQDNFLRLSERYGANLDASRADFQIAIGLINRGAGLVEAIAVLLACTPTMTGRRHRDPAGYMLRTVMSAKAAV